MTHGSAVATSRPKRASWSLRWEQASPFIWAVALTVVSHISGVEFPSSTDGLYGTAATVASVFAGFLGVAQSVMLTIQATEVYKRLSKAGYIEDFYQYLRVGIYAAVLFAALSIVGFFVREETLLFTYKIYMAFQAAWLLCAFLSFFTYWRVAKIFFKLLSQT